MSKKYYEFRPDDEVAQPSDVTSDTSHLKSEGVANQYSSTSAYAVGDFCMYEGKAYMCNTAIASPGETWTAAHWTLANLSSLFTSANTSLNLSNVRTASNDSTSAKSYIDTSISDACPYGVNVLSAQDLQLVDGCVNTITLNAADVHLVLPTMPLGKQADLLIEITVAAGATVSGFSIVAPTGATMERIRMTDDVTLEAPTSGTTIYQFMYTSRRTDDGSGTPAYRVYSAQKKGEVVT